jgi:DHA1 family bicyclomycin/chloramphenicol resistance-like MFS transporter
VSLYLMYKTLRSTQEDAPTPQRSLEGRPFIILLAALTALTALSIDMSLPAMPQLQQVFHADVATVQLTLSLFLIGYAMGQLICGPLSDRWGRRPVLLMGVLLFTLAGLGCAVSRTLPLLITLRLVQGIGASVGPILGRAMVRDSFDNREAVGVLSQITQVMILAPLLAPTIGSYLLVFFGWPAIFVLLGACGALIWLVSWRFLPETGTAHTETTARPSLVAGFRSVISHGSSLRYALIVCFSSAGMFAYVSGSPFVLMEVFHVARQNFGYCFALAAGGLLIGATVNRALISRRSSRSILRLGIWLLFGAAGLLLLMVCLNLGGLLGVLLPMMGYLFAMGLIQPNATALAMEPHGRAAGAAASVMGGLQTLGGAIAGYFVGAFYNQTAMSLAVTIAVLATATRLIFRDQPEPDSDA